MSSQFQPSPLDALAGRRFSFFPAIRGIEHNEWSLEADTWSEIQAKNTATGDLIWIPRNHLGEISSSDSPVLIIGLHRELEYTGDVIRPYRKPMVETPAPRRASRSEPATGTDEPAPAVGATSRAESGGIELIGKAVLILLVAVVFGAALFTQGISNPIERFFPTSTKTSDQRYLGLNASDGYHDVVIKLGRAATEDWISRSDAELQFQVMAYPDRGYDVILMGASRGDTRYIGTLHDPTRKILDSARMAGGGTTTSMLKNLPKFE